MREKLLVMKFGTAQTEPSSGLKEVSKRTAPRSWPTSTKAESASIKNKIFLLSEKFTDASCEVTVLIN